MDTRDECQKNASQREEMMMPTVLGNFPVSYAINSSYTHNTMSPTTAATNSSTMSISHNWLLNILILCLFMVAPLLSSSIGSTSATTVAPDKDSISSPTTTTTTPVLTTQHYVTSPDATRSQFPCYGYNETSRCQLSYLISEEALLHMISTTVVVAKERGNSDSWGDAFYSSSADATNDATLRISIQLLQSRDSNTHHHLYDFTNIPPLHINKQHITDALGTKNLNNLEIVLWKREGDAIEVRALELDLLLDAGEEGTGESSTASLASDSTATATNDATTTTTTAKQNNNNPQQPFHISFSLSNITLSADTTFTSFDSISLSHLQPPTTPDESSLKLHLSSCGDVALQYIKWRPRYGAQGDISIVLEPSMDGNIVLRELQVENTGFVTPLSILLQSQEEKVPTLAAVSSVDSMKTTSSSSVSNDMITVPSLLIDSCSFMNNQNGAVQISQQFLIQQLTIQDSIFDSNQGAGLNAMLAITDGVLVNQLRVIRCKVIGSVGYYNGGGLQVDFSQVQQQQFESKQFGSSSSVDGETRVSDSSLEVFISDSTFAKNAAGPQQHGGSLYIVAPSSSTATTTTTTTSYSLTVTVENTQITDSVADQGTGAGIYMEGSKLILSKSSVLQQNHAAQGAAIHLAEGILEIVEPASEQEDPVLIRNNLADVFAGGVLFTTTTQALESQMDPSHLEYNVVSVGAQRQMNPNVAVLQPASLHPSTRVPLHLKPYYPYAAGSTRPGERTTTSITGYFADYYGNAITLQSQLDEDATSALYKSLRVHETDPQHLQFHEGAASLDIATKDEGFEISPVEIVGEIGAHSNITLASTMTGTPDFVYPIIVDACSEGHLPTSVGKRDALNPAQAHLKYCAFGDDPDLDNDEETGHSLKTVWRILALTVIILIGILSFITLLLVGVILRKNGTHVEEQERQTLRYLLGDEREEDIQDGDDFAV